MIGAMRTLGLLTLVLVGGCVASPADVRVPATPAEWSEYRQALAPVERVVKALYAANAEFCQTCVQRVGIGISSGIAAWTDGKSISLSTAQVRSDGDGAALAATIAHEWAHILLKHIDKMDTTPRRLLELEADCVGTFLAARAGYDPRGGIASRRREQIGTIDGITHTLLGMSGGYPNYGERYSVIEAAARAAAGRPITRDLIRQTCGVAP